MEQNISDIKYYILFFYEANPEAGRELWRHIDKQKLADMLLGKGDLYDAVSFLKLLFQKDHGIGQELWEHIDRENFDNILFRAFYLSSSDSLSDHLFGPLLVKNPDTGRIHWGSIDTDDVKEVASGYWKNDGSIAR